jgi:hypothetical protein
MKPKRTNFTQWILVAAFLTSSANLRAEDCLGNLPDLMKSAVEQDHWKILSPFDLPPDDWKLWKNAHQGQCPGVAVGNFYPKTDKSYVVALIQGDDPKNLLEKLVLVTYKKDQPVTEIVVNPVHATTLSVVWKLPQGHYAGVDGKKASISRDSFIFEKIASSATQFYYQGSKLQTFVISN